MPLSRRGAGFLLAIAVWDVVIWVTFIRNLAADHGRPTAFYVVHGVLIVINLALAAGLGYLGWRAWRGSSGVGRVPDANPDGTDARPPVTPAGRSTRA